MGARQDKIACKLCGNEYAKKGLTRHFQSCLKKLEDPPGRSKEKLFLLRIEGKYNPQYWLYLELPARERFGTLDLFLRRLWLECCGHMSAFDFGKHYPRSFEYDDWGRSPEMGLKLGEVLQPRMKFEHEYDFGSTTALSLQVVHVRHGAPVREPIHVLARNEAPSIPCGICKKKQATQLCPFCAWEPDGWFCDGCEERHGCGEDILMPVVNSPRVGVCGYEDEVDEEAVMRFMEPKKASAKALAKYAQVEELLREKWEWSEDELEMALGIWARYTSECPDVRSVAVHAASLEYIVACISRREATQASVAKKYGTSAASISQKYSSIASFLMDDEDSDFDDEAFAGGWIFAGELEQSPEIDTQALMKLMPEEAKEMLQMMPKGAQAQALEFLASLMLPGGELELDFEQEELLEELPLIEQTWVGGRHDLPLEKASLLPFQPTLCLWTTQAGELVEAHGIAPPGAAPQALLDLLLEAMDDPEAGPPGRRKKLLLAQADLVGPFRELLGPYGIEIQHGGAAIIEKLATQLEEDLARRESSQLYLQDPIQPQTVAAMFEASAELFEQAPWELLSDDVTFLVDLSSWGLGRYSVCVLGAAGMVEGILLFDSQGDFEKFREFSSGRAGRASPGVGMRSLDFESLGEQSPGARKELMEHGWSMDSPHAYPALKRISPELRLLPLEADDFTVATACAWGVALFTKEHRKHLKKVDRGQAKSLSIRAQVPMIADRPAIEIALPYPIENARK